MTSKKISELERLKKEAQAEREACKQHFKNGGRETMKKKLKASKVMPEGERPLLE